MRPLSRCILASLLLAGLAPTAAAYTEPPLESYTRQSPNRAFVFVMLHAARPGWPNPIGEKYLASGLYRNDGSVTPLWTFDDGYVREAYPASDGVHLVVQYLGVVSLTERTCGNSPRTPPANPAVLGFYASGKKIRDVKLGELLDHVAFCDKYGLGYHSWLRSASINDEDGTLAVVTTEDTHRTLNLRTGDRIHPLLGEIGHPFLGERSIGSYAGIVLGIVFAMATIAGTVVVAIVLFRSRPAPRE